MPRGGGNGSRSRPGGRPSDTFGIDEALHDRKPRSRSKASAKKRKGKGKSKSTSHRKRDGVRNRDDFDGNNNDDDNDDDDDDDGNDDYRPRQRSSRPPPGYHEEDRYGYDPRRDRRPPPRPRRRQQGPGMLGTAGKVAKKTVDLTTAATWTTLKGSGKAAFYLVSPKHVRRDEIFGVWRLDQQRMYPDAWIVGLEWLRAGVAVSFFILNLQHIPGVISESSREELSSLVYFLF